MTLPHCQKKKRSRKLEKNPKSVRFSGFQTKATVLADAKKELYKFIPEAASVVFLSSRPNQKTMNGWVNFNTAKDCEEFIKKLSKDPRNDFIKMVKPGEHDKPHRCGILHFTSSLSLLKDWKKKKFPSAGADIQFNAPEETRFLNFVNF